MNSQERNKNSNLAGDNRLQVLLFGLGTKQSFGINIFKVKEILKKPVIRKIAKSNPLVVGVANIRNSTVPVIDIKAAVGMGNLKQSDNNFIILVEYSNTTLAFIVDSVAKIINMSWKNVSSVPFGAGNSHYLSAIAKHDNGMIGILDVEKVLDKIIPNTKTEVSKDIIKNIPKNIKESSKILVVDDSSVARNQIKKCLESVGLETDCFNDGAQALEHLHNLVNEGVNPTEKYAMVVSDIEMPKMDGYTLTSEIKSSDKTKELPVILHTSLSGGFNDALVKRVGANEFVSKFSPDALGDVVIKQIKKIKNFY